MKRILLIILTLTFSIVVYGQKLQFKTIDKDYSWQTATKSQIDSFYYDLNPLQISKMQIHIRISFTGQVIDLLSIDGVNYTGVLTNIITEYKSKKTKGQEYDQSVEQQEVFQKIELNNAKVKVVVDSLIASKQSEFPTDSIIPNWNTNFLHCGSIHFQYKIDQKFKTQAYFCPWSQNDKVAYRNLIVDNCNLIKTIFTLDSLYKKFENDLPKGKSYSRDGYRMMYKMTDKQSQRWAKAKPKRDFLKNIKDTVNTYIKARLDNQEIELVEMDCFEDYRLIFGKNGRLKKIDVSKHDKPKLRNSLGFGDFLDEKKEIRKCKRKIKEIFKEIDLSFLNLEHEIHRTFSFDLQGQYRLNDDTVY